MKPIIKVENLSKRYSIGAQQAPYATLRESLVGAVRAPFDRLRRKGPLEDTTIWALKGVSFEVIPGEVVGVIGRNGAGKSTLLKILSRITEPTAGGVDLYGRVGSLLEVGTGFHAELTGRENVYLNGAILGMKKAEIKRKFHEIVDFAELEKFIDTPVKHYSSGMYMRLAFSVAAHLDPEILLVDEVLAVGDANFQKKCLGKMEEVGAQGRTVFFVSHSMPMVLRLCNRAILLTKGEVKGDGAPSKITRAYMNSDLSSQAERTWPNVNEAPGDSVARLRAVRIKNAQGLVVYTIDVRQSFYIEVEYWSLQTSLRPTAILHLMDEHGNCLFATNEFNNPNWRDKPLVQGLIRATCHIPSNLLAEGTVSILAAVGSYNPNVVHAIERDAVSIQVVDNSAGDGVRGTYSGEWPGLLRPMLDWRIAYDYYGPPEGLS